MNDLYSYLKQNAWPGKTIYSLNFGNIVFDECHNGIIYCHFNEHELHYNKNGQPCVWSKEDKTWVYDNEVPCQLFINKNEATIKGYGNIDREFVKNENPDVFTVQMSPEVTHTIEINKKVKKFDADKDFTVRELIEALSKFDMDLPVCAAMNARAIGYFDDHIHKVDKFSLYGYDKQDCVGIFIDDKYSNDDFDEDDEGYVFD